MPDGAEPSVDIARLRTAYAGRLLKRLVERGGRSEIVRKLVALHRAEPGRAYTLLLEPTLSVAIETDAMATAVAVTAVSLARIGALGTTRLALAPVTHVACVEANLLARGVLHVADHTLWVNGEAFALDEAAPHEGPLEKPFPTITGHIRLALFDPNPLSSHETHPDKEGNSLSLGGRSVSDWLDALRVAFALVERHLPGIAAEMHAMLRLVIPVGASDERHLSASYREYIGAVYLTLHRDPVTMAEALVHEFQHNKLNLLSWHYPILENGYDFLYQSPVRPDPRPLMGILLAAHAFVPVAELHRRVLDDDGIEVDKAGVTNRLLQVVARNQEALTVLERHARPAPAGALVLARLHALHAPQRAAVPELPQDVSHVA